MAENTDAAIKLFGKTIPLRHREHEEEEEEEEEGRGEEEKLQEPHKEEHTPKSSIQRDEPANSQEKNEATTITTSEMSKTPSADQEDDSTKNSAMEEQATTDASNPKERTSKKPDKILPCPRCKSLDTKFCYYNNYNVNQPRHFCKNCQRYWTAGGTMRNVPVGAGRRKNKNLCHYRQISITESTLQALRSEEPSAHYSSLRPNGTVLSFGSSAALCNSMSSANLSEKANRRNGFFPEEAVAQLVPCAVNNGGEKLRSPLTAAKLEETSKIAFDQKKSQSLQAPAAQIPCSNGSTWSYPWNPALPLCASNIPIPVYPAAAYWSCTVPPGSWSIPWPSPAVSSFPNGCHPGGAATSSPPSLGKHPRDGEDDHRQINHETCILVPKMMRIDDPEKAASSSIWTMVGIKSNKNSSVGGGELLKAFQPKGGIKSLPSEAPSLLHVNPAALSRSLNFQETS